MDETHSKMNRFKKLHLKEYRPPRRVRNFFHYNRTSVIPISEDGSCLFRCLSRCVHGTQTRHLEVRAEVCRELERGVDTYKSFINTESSTTEDYVRHMREEGTWGGEPELVAAANVYGCAFLILDAEEPAKDHVVGNTRSNGTPHVLGFVGGNHYVLLVNSQTASLYKGDRDVYRAFSAKREREERASREEAQRLGREERARQRIDHFYLPPAPVGERKGSEEMEEGSGEKIEDEKGQDEKQQPAETGQTPPNDKDDGGPDDNERERERDQMMGALPDAPPQENKGTGGADALDLRDVGEEGQDEKQQQDKTTGAVPVGVDDGGHEREKDQATVTTHPLSLPQTEQDPADVDALRTQVSKLKTLLAERDARIAELEEAALPSPAPLSVPLKPSTPKSRRVRAVPRCGRPRTCPSLFHMRERNPVGLARVVNAFASSLTLTPTAEDLDTRGGLRPGVVQRAWMVWLAEHHGAGMKRHRRGIKGLIFEVCTGECPTLGGIHLSLSRTCHPTKRTWRMNASS